MITRLDNLSIYWLEDSHRRHIDEVAKRDRVENYESIKEDYVVEDYACGCLVENIEILEPKDEKPAEKTALIADDTNYDALATAIVNAVKVASAPVADSAGADVEGKTAVEKGSK